MENNSHDNGISDFTKIYSSIGFCLIGGLTPIVTGLAFVLPNQFELIIYISVFIIFYQAFKYLTMTKSGYDQGKVADRASMVSSESVLFYKKADFKHIAFYYINYISDYMLLPFILGLYLASMLN